MIFSDLIYVFFCGNFWFDNCRSRNFFTFSMSVSILPLPTYPVLHCALLFQQVIQSPHPPHTLGAGGEEVPLMGRGVEGGGVGEGGLLGTTGVGAEGEGVWWEDSAGQPRPEGTHLTLTPAPLTSLVK